MRALVLLAAALAPAPVLAQHQHHQAPPPAEADPHAGHSASPAGPHAGHAMEPAEPHAGHADAPADPHAGHAMDSGPDAAAAPPVAPPPPEALSGPAHAADRHFDPEAMAAAREELRAMHGDMWTWGFRADQVEARIGEGSDHYAWEDVGIWYGGDIDRFWIKTQGEGIFGGPVERVEIQALWSHAITPFFDLQGGLRHDLRPGKDRSYLVLGVEGLAPYWLEVDAAAYLSEKGDVSARFEVEYDQRITQRLILQPRAEIELALQDVPELGIGSGLSTAEAGLRLRYAFVPEFAPYVGVHYERAFGDTARLRRLAGDDAGGWSLVAGVRAWF